MAYNARHKICDVFFFKRSGKEDEREKKESRGPMTGVSKDLRIASTKIIRALHMSRDKHQNKIGC